MQKFVLCAGLLVGSFFLQAAHADYDISGPFIGASIGVANNLTKLRFTNTSGVVQQRLNAGDVSATLNMNVGYGKFWGNFYLGALLYGGYNTSKARVMIQADQNSFKLDRNWTAGGEIRVGRSLFSQQFLAYIGLGLQATWHKFSPTQSANLLGEERFTSPEFVPSIGIMGMVTDKMFLSFQVNYTMGLSQKSYMYSLGTYTLRPNAVGAVFLVGYKF